MLKLSNVTKQFSQTPILKNVDISIEKGSITGLAGPSGGGKSTLLRCIQKLESIDSGKIEYSGTCTFMFQDFQLFPHMTVLENLIYAPNIVFGNKESEKEALNLLKLLGLESKTNHYPAELSGGQKQRVALARCLMMKPDILLCDEPTSGLDVATIDDVVQLLQSVHAMGVTMVIASHDLAFLTRIAKRIVVLKSDLKVLEFDISQLSDPINIIKNLY
ncbi:ATP-binding cassette domain-containing protein [Candidatus Berkiella aquae]|uniref:ATP-binding cassette domain-containing protein n=1 Tax=Candidatus Berkiella aquae TaxID=295108 RepID=A0A0Q9YPL5_9GAMM|nr:ATP-binding cassette domain-containing protein [Candidatus Berkiella aquae]MCS5711922.1 ATP-binding cassette domain-containing protein [Candidatus Berkiella aquae]